MIFFGALLFLLFLSCPADGTKKTDGKPQCPINMPTKGFFSRLHIVIIRSENILIETSKATLFQNIRG
jgi:hypothetical protein